jgi:hypothetical protein
VITSVNKTLDAAADRIERATGLDAVADPMAEAADTVLRPRWLTNLLSGTPIGHPLHPLLVTVPIGAWSSSIVFDLTGDEEAATTLVGFGVLAALPTAVAAAAKEGRCCKEGRGCSRRWSSLLPRKGGIAAGGGRLVAAAAKEGRRCCRRWSPKAGVATCAAVTGSVNKKCQRTMEIFYRRLLRRRSWLTEDRHRDVSPDF